MATGVFLTFLLGGFLHTAGGTIVINKTTQGLPATCRADDCSPQSLLSLQSVCCDNATGLHVHCQERKGGDVIVACLPNATCDAGSYAKLYKETEEGQEVAWVECLPCDNSTFQPDPTDTTQFRYDRCSETKTSCTAVSLNQCYPGGTTEDDKCRCNPQTSYAPDRSVQNVAACLRCFGQEDHCPCVLKTCPGGHQLDDDYVCSNETTTSTSSPDSSSSSMTTQPGTSSEAPHSDSDKSTTGDLQVALAVIGGLILVVVFVIIFCVCCS